MGVYSFRSGPTYRAASPDEQFTAAFDMPLSVSSTLGEQFKGGILDSLGLGTTIREVQLPDEAPTSPMATMAGPDGETITVPDTPQMRRRATVQGFDLGQETPEQFAQRRREAGALDENQYKTSPYFREGVKWDMGMTADRAAALAEAYDAKRVREYFASKRPFTAFIGNLAGQAVDPINYIPIAGPAVKAASVAKFGRVAGSAAVGALDAAANTAIASGVTYDARKSMGDDITWQSTVTDIAMSALIGSAFGTISGVVDARRSARIEGARQEAQQRLATLKNVQDARIALNGAIDGLARGEDVSLPANGAEVAQRVAGRASEFGLDLTTPLTSRPDFNEWFSGSAVTDDAGAPMVVYHGTGGNFDDFRIDATGSAMDAGKLGRGFYFSTRPDVASGYANASEVRGGSPNVMPVYLSIKNPVVFDASAPGNIWQKLRAKSKEWEIDLDPVQRGDETGMPNDAWAYAFSEVAQEKGFDGVVLKFKDGSKELVAFNASQIKSSLNRGRFSGDDTKIIDTSPARPESPPSGRNEAEARIAKPETFKETAEQHKVNADDGSFIEQAEVDQLRTEGRLMADDDAALAEAQQTFDNGVAYGEALKAVAGCFI